MQSVIADIRWWLCGLIVRNSHLLPFNWSKRARQTALSAQMPKSRLYW